ncbi:MAG: hypothetical protein QOE77_2103 [Blastocatellia bacterium]|jgi:hypothetical protein|nr:hypothetical protein [Blastocatellia bacterium]
MIVCDFCLQFRADGACALGLKIPKGMSCRDFGPGIEKFCSNPNDFVDPKQIVQMATYFGMKGTELKKVRLMASGEVSARATDALNAVEAAAGQ